MRFKRLPIIFALVLVLSTFFSSFVFAENNVKPNLVALGDSITYGWNLDPDHTKPSTLAFPYLIGSGKYNVTKNISFPGWTSTELLIDLSKPENIAAIQGANVITLDIGNNDLLQAPGVKEVLENPPAPDLPPDQLKVIIDTAALAATNASAQIAMNLTKIIGAIKQLNPDAQIVLYNLYNPFGAGIVHNLGEQIIPGINAGVIKPIATQTGSVVADAYAAMDGKQADFILPGDIHPNEEGHKALAAAGEQALSALKSQLQLTPSTTDETSEQVSITITSNAKKILSLKWIAGEKTVNDFAATGNDITDGKFQVTENGTYTVYLFNSYGLESLTTITINNIKAKENPTPTPTTTPTPTPTSNTGGTGHTLPNTATPMYNYLSIGLGLILAGLAAMQIQQYRRRENS